MIREANSSATILLVDDTPGSIGVALTALEEAGYHVSIAMSGEKALQRAALVLPDLILLDVIMPGLDGYETCRRLKAQEATRDIPVIFLSALIETFDKVKGFGLGAVDYLIKPVATEELLARVRTHVTIGRLERELRAANRSLEERVAARLVELKDANARLLAEIEERKRTGEALRESETSLRTLTESMPQLVWMCRNDGWNIYFNQRWVDYTGLTLDESYGHGWNKPFHPDDQQRAWNAWQQATRTGGRYDLECRLRQADGSYHWFLIRGLPLRNATGDITKWFGTCTNIDDQKRAQEEVRKLNEDLEERVRQRTADLQQKTDELRDNQISLMKTVKDLNEKTMALEVANKELESFSYSVSHDLRAPLRSIDGFSEALLEDYGDKLDAEGKEFLRKVRAASQRMSQLIDDMLMLATVTRSEIRRGPVDLSALARSIASELQAQDPGRRVEFVIAPELVAQTDAHLMRIALENLLGNAWKFTGKQAAARIEFGQTSHEGAPAYFVRDNGVGFDMAHAQKLFGVFQRLHDTAEFPGTGIGLATVHRIIRRQGGRVWAESARGQGATFYFTLSG
jgi:PAS domain S-box-containing protein